MRAGQQAEQLQDYDRAVVEYTKALQAAARQSRRPPGARPRQAARRAGSLHARPPARRRPAGSTRRSSSCSSPPSSTRRAATSTKLLRDVRTQLRTKVAVAREGKTQLETLIERTRDLPPPGLDLPGRRAAAGVADLPRRQLARRLHRAGPLRQRQRRVRPAVPRRSRSPSTCATPRSRTRSRRCRRRRATSIASPAQRTITVIPDTPAKRREYEEEIVRTFYLSNADLKETIDLLRIVIDARRIAPITATNAHLDQGHAGARRRRRRG